jgi:DNA repair exonuclease SbcCD nuclease subunit
METFQKIGKMGVFVVAIAGNHDLEGKDADTIGNAMQALGALTSFDPVTAPTDLFEPKIALLPWYSDINELRAKIKTAADNADPGVTDLVIHAPLNGVIKGIPDAGLDPAELSDLGFNRVFVGHFHNHKSFENGKVYSVGATTHQTWNDPGSRAGFCMVYPDRVEFIPSSAPSFVDIKKPEEVEEEVVSGNYVRLKLVDVTEAEIKTFRTELENLGAKGVNIIATKKTESTRAASISSGASLEVSVAEYIEKDSGFSDQKKLQELASSILTEARSR